MSVDDKLKNLRKSMKQTSLKDIEADKEKTKQYVMSHKKKRFSMNGPKRFAQIGASIVGMAALILFVVYAGSGEMDLTQGDQSGLGQEEAKEDLRYEMVVIDDEGELEDKEWKYLYNKQPMENYMKETRLLSDKSMEARRILASNPRPEGMYFPIAYVFDSENDQLIYRTDQLEDLKDFLPLLYQSPEPEQKKGEFTLSGITLGDSFNKVLEQLGEPDVYSPSSDHGPPYAVYKEGKTTVMGVSIGEENKVSEIRVEVAKTKEMDVPRTMKSVKAKYGEPTSSMDIVCSERDTCLVEQYDLLDVKYKTDGKTVDYIEYDTPELEEEFMKSFLPKEKGTVSAIYVEGEDEIEGMQDVMKEHRGLALSNSLSIQESPNQQAPSIYNVMLQVFLTYNLSEHGEVLLLDDEGEVLLRTKEIEKVDEFLEDWEAKK
ncbi:hypothetical protein N780_05220 [Pontibacillus chungwhensis BH030062]|uniref:Uncharacterized protein n=1 Tax=Pontibacillus chungwhensis BH030062 TaxID=1385513 RepID=A0A0A2UUJ3_9BACI|nr:DUF4309 domain-containing protein [Pontibacillus chungwhensis]KGP90393.1 hypothetical protein N780_05220 [Pontibacillus chungwhensis BH030062]